MVRVRLLDGGLGTSLERRYNVSFSHDRPLWSSDLLISDPETLLACQSDFGKVPVDILTTATYQVSIEGFAGTKTAEFPEGVKRGSVPPFLETALSIAARAKASHASLSLGLGPYGACMVPSQEYSGAYDSAHSSVEALLEWHRQRLDLFASLGNLQDRISLLAFETVPRVDEIIAVRKTLESFPVISKLPFWISCLYPGNDGTLPDGTSAEGAVTAMLSVDVAPCRPWGIGINCTKVEKLDGLVRRYETSIKSMVDQGQLTEWPALVLYPDGTRGESYNTVTQQWELSNAASSSERPPWEKILAQVVKDTTARGRWAEIVVGGCCMAGADDIAKLRDTLLSERII